MRPKVVNLFSLRNANMLFSMFCGKSIPKVWLKGFIELPNHLVPPTEADKNSLTLDDLMQ